MLAMDIAMHLGVPRPLLALTAIEAMAPEITSKTRALTDLRLRVRSGGRSTRSCPAQASAGPPQATALHTLVWHMLGMGYRAVSNIVGKAMNRIARPDGSMSRDSKHISDLYTNVLRKHCARRLSKVGWAGVRLSRPLGSIG